jgi:hypothetical protein
VEATCTHDVAEHCSQVAPLSFAGFTSWIPWRPAYCNRWELVKEIELIELRRTSMDIKLRQLSALMASRGLFAVDPERENGVQCVRDRWAQLRQAIATLLAVRVYLCSRSSLVLARRSRFSALQNHHKFVLGLQRYSGLQLHFLRLL